MSDRLLTVDVLLVGGGVASVRCARVLRREGFVGSVLLVTEEQHLPYNRPPLSKEALADLVPTDLLLAEPARWYDRRDIQVETRRRVASIDRIRRVAELEDGNQVSFDMLLLATGATPRLPPITGVERAQVLRTLDDAAALRATAPPGSAVAIIGGGFIGVEVAATLAIRGVHVTLLEAADELWGGSLGHALSGWAEEILARLGVRVRLGTAATAIHAGSVAIGGERVEADATLMCVGVTPREELARACGLPCDDGILTDRRQATTDPAVFAAGDVARVAGRRIEHWHAAREGGERAGLAMLGRELPPLRAPWVFSDVGEHHFDVVGTPSGAQRSEVLSDRPGAIVVAWLADGDRVAQAAATDGAFDVDSVRQLIERGGTLSDLEGLRTPT
ncbi:MAG: NAD(P)/FAD-dependent oxidoreductase [Candidatus Limnocylindria bacterium]